MSISSLLVFSFSIPAFAIHPKNCIIVFILNITTTNFIRKAELLRPFSDSSQFTWSNSPSLRFHLCWSDGGQLRSAQMNRLVPSEIDSAPETLENAPTVDTETRRRLDHRNHLYALGSKKSKAQNAEMAKLSEELSELGFASDFKDPYLEMFVKQMALHTQFHKDVLTPEEQAAQNKAAGKIIDKILAKRKRHEAH